MIDRQVSTDVAVVGGGVIGLTCAWRLAQRGLRVCVIDPAPAAASSRAAAGMLAPISEVTYGELAVLEFGKAALEGYPQFVAELEADSRQVVGLRKDGTMIVATDAGDREMLGELHAFQTRLGLSATMLTSAECRTREPMLSPAVRCGLVVESDYSVDNRRVCAALLGVLEGVGVELVGQRVAEVETTGGAVSGVGLDDDRRIAAPAVVLAAGPWSGTIAGLPPSAQPPVRPVKGQILRMRADDPAVLPSGSIRGLVNGQEAYFVPRADGELVVGATVEEVGFDTTVRAGAIREILRDARAIIPAVDELELAEISVGLRPGSPDNAPVIGRTEIDGLVVATGHYRNGILMAPLTADLVAALVTDTATETDNELLRVVEPSRFHEIATPA
ncbi:MAG TPA: glycine oxidase ThiO [Mycobacteriales bacterium]|nr:glycine oxidase ThiO [Mycobacteriales bacterium]